MTNAGDIDNYTRVRTYKVLADNYYDQSRILLSLLPLAMRMAGPREALWHALIRRNYGANHIIIGRDHASPGLAANGHPYYPSYAAQELVEQFSDELGIRPLPHSEFVYLSEEDRYEERSFYFHSRWRIGIHDLLCQNLISHSPQASAWGQSGQVCLSNRFNGFLECANTKPFALIYENR